MPDLNFQVTGVKAAVRGLIPLLNFQLEVTNQPALEQIHSVILHAQIQIQAPQRNYNAREKEKLVELFGRPGEWGNTLRNRLWTNANTIVGTFSGKTSAELSIPCSFDLNLAATKYAYALEDGDMPLLFLFSGSIFYAAPAGGLQVQQISWNKESSFRMPAQLWREMMDEHFPNSAWLYLRRDVFDQLYAYKRSHGLANWEQTMEKLLAQVDDREEVLT